MCVWQIITPVARHPSPGGITIGTFHQSHRQSFHVEGRMEKRTLAGKANQIPINKQKINGNS
jgi:hypothetical protein